MASGYTHNMTKRLVDIDDSLLREAQQLLGAETMKETVNRALGEVIDLDRRRRLLDRMSTGKGVDLSDETMRAAWE
jgi:Arc/MetJ family transcription regulator